ncbi:MAG: diaminopimelate epimerase [Nitrospirota bacterium]
MKLQFTKAQALGNDFILIDDRKGRLKKIGRLAKYLCDRKFGIGADQLLLLNNSRTADFIMRVFNADGSEVEMCGNGIRCIAKYIWDNKIRGQESGIRGQELSIETLAGIIHLQKKGNLIKVDMGEPILEPKKIPVNISSNPPLPPFTKGGRGGINSSIVTEPALSLPKGHSSLVKNFPIKIEGKIFKITCVSMGNPHAVIVEKNVQTIPLNQYGPAIENHKFFPKRTNVEFIQVQNRSNIKMRVWERGAGETMACGTGASASAVASVLLGLTDRKVTVHLPGGKLSVEWSAKNNHVYMTGPAVKVFEGEIEI